MQTNNEGSSAKVNVTLERAMFRKGLNVTYLSNATGVSRTTITALIKGQAKGIQFTTMATLCDYLDITPNELFTIERSTWSTRK